MPIYLLDSRDRDVEKYLALLTVCLTLCVETVDNMATSPYIDLSGTRLTAMWMGDPAGGLDILHLLIDDDSIENEHHYSLCGIEYHAQMAERV